ncbi:MAG TPA: DUF4350 domain-containing protein, partial [Verrucomicrobiae bacterium]|nr:DUF4350 domain-containing protein [Verrucomicrobiae bacterium]
MKRSFSIAVLLACAGLFAFGIARLFALRFQAGDVYPPYSSLRADPLGTMALYEGLEKMPGISVRRDYSADDRLPDEPRTVYLQLASGRRDWDWMPDDLYQEIRRYLARGNRLVITFFPQTEADYRFHGETSRTNTAATPPEKKTMKQPPGKAKPSEPDHEPGMSPATEWGFQVSFRALEADGNNYLPAAAMRRADLPLPATLAWHSGLVFTNLDPAWQVIYARGTNAVVIERRFGPGSVVMATDSYLVSNEAMLKDRQAALLAWLVGANRHVVFDESHFGIVETSSVAMLVRKYRLHGLVAGLLLLAVLFLWKNSTSLVPAVPAPRPGA